jgi:hypothetical protein
MAVSTHLLPLVMIGSTDEGAFVTTIVFQLRHMLVGGGIFREPPGKHELGCVSAWNKGSDSNSVQGTLMLEP